MVPSWRDQARGNSGSRDDRLTFSCQCHLGEQLPLVQQTLARYPDLDYLVGGAIAAEVAVNELSQRHLDRPQVLSTYFSHGVQRGLRRGKILAANKYVDTWSRRLQLLSASAYALGHGGNDAQKTIGIIWMLLISAGITKTNEHVPYWVVVACYSAIGLGTIFGGWRIIKLMGQKITKLRPVGGFCAQTGGAATLFFATALGIPVSTPHTITGANVGVGATTRLSAVRWGIAGTIVWAWILTIPCSALISALFWYVGRLVL